MNREQIEKAGRDYALDQLGIVGLPGRADAMKAFVAGADWRINSVWHDAREMPKQGKHIVVVMKGGNFTSWFVTPDIMQVFDKFNVELWASSSDLLPERKEETNGGR